MTPWSDLQGAFAEALLDPRAPVPAGAVDPEGSPCARRFGVYRNNVAVGLSGALGESFPAVRRLVGDDFFRAMAIAYARFEPPRSPVMAAYGAGFPDFIAGFEPAAGLPYLPDVARIEQAWVEAYHAADCDPIDPAVFSSVEPEALPHLRLKLHPSLRVLRSPWAALSIWRCNTEPAEGGAIEDVGTPEDTLVLRPEAEVEVRAVAPGGARLLQALAAGRSVLEAWGEATREQADFDLAAHLAALLDMGAIAGFER